MLATFAIRKGEARMGRKVKAAKASLVAAFLAAGGAAATAKAGSSSNAQTSGSTASATAVNGSLEWGSALVRFLKLDGFPAYLKIDNFADYYKLLSVDELSVFYDKNRDPVDGVLALYQKGGTAQGSMLEGILIGLEQYFKYDNRDVLFNFVKGEDALAAYQKFATFYGALEKGAPDALSFFQKETGINGVPAVQFDGELG
jgi:hypothetical protein